LTKDEFERRLGAAEALGHRQGPAHSLRRKRSIPLMTNAGRHYFAVRPVAPRISNRRDTKDKDVPTATKLSKYRRSNQSRELRLPWWRALRETDHTISNS
jgi:hypothetical protein